jgi:hypothetical protein
MLPTRRRSALFEETQNNARRSVAKAERDPEYRRVAAEVERTGNQSLFADYERARWRCSTHLKRMCPLVRRVIHVKVTRWRSLRANRDRGMRGRKKGSRNKVTERPNCQNRFKMALKPGISVGL